MLTQSIGDDAQHLPIPVHAHMATIDLNVLHKPGPLVVTACLPCNHTVRSAVDRGRADGWWNAKAPDQRGIDACELPPSTLDNQSTCRQRCY